MATRRRRAQDAGNYDAEMLLRESYTELVDEVERKVKLSDASTFTRDRMSTGFGSLDLILGGGIAPGMYTFFGPEQSCKTTTALMVMGSALTKDVPLIGFWDYEGSAGADPEYMESILTTLGAKGTVEDVFGLRDPLSGKWAKRPRVRYRDDTVAELFFDWLSGVERRLPDKKFIGGKWCYIFEDTKQNRARYGEFLDKKMMSQMGSGLIVPAKDGALQAVVLLDSYPAMNPESQDVDDPNESIAVQARMFSRQLPRIKGRLRSKRIALIGINQLRDAPLVMYGPKENEPGGKALRFNSDARVRLTPRSLSGVPFHPKGEGQIEKSRSIEYKGYDSYRYIHARAVKNKLGPPMRETWLRLWIEDGEGKARGLDPVWDTIQYLSLTGQLDGRRAAVRIRPGAKDFESKSFNLDHMKSLVLGDKQTVAEFCTDIGIKSTNIRQAMFKQLASGKAEALYVANKNASLLNKDKGKDDDEGGDED